jgi:hypothetical protein
MTPRADLALFMIFFELVMPNLGAASHQIGTSLRKIEKIHPQVCATKRELICISQVV